MKKQPLKDLVPILAQIEHINCLGKSTWYEVVYYSNNNWHSYAGSKTFTDGEKVINWRYCEDLMKNENNKKKT